LPWSSSPELAGGAVGARAEVGGGLPPAAGGRLATSNRGGAPAGLVSARLRPATSSTVTSPPRLALSIERPRPSSLRSLPAGEGLTRPRSLHLRSRPSHLIRWLPAAAAPHALIACIRRKHHGQPASSQPPHATAMQQARKRVCICRLRVGASSHSRTATTNLSSRGGPCALLTLPSPSLDPPTSSPLHPLRFQATSTRRLTS
jgi:hypothetical protein